ncbi:MAG: Ig-like domain-containing protein [Vicinamibacterales bacterium]
MSDAAGSSLLAWSFIMRTRAIGLVLAAMVMAGIPAAARAQGVLANGENHTGTITFAGEVQVWTFAANQGQAINLSIGERVRTPDSGFWPWIRLINPNGAQISSSSGNLVAQISVSAPLTGTYQVWVASNDTLHDALGDYTLTLANIPGPFGVSSGDDGGPLGAGLNQAGHIAVGDLDMWSFSATQNAAILLSAGEVLPTSGPDPGFWPWIRLYDPNGVQIGSASGTLVAQISTTAPLDGTYTVVVGTADTLRDAQGDYRLRLFTIPGNFTIPTGDQGGSLGNGENHPGHIDIGDLDIWTFTANKDDYIELSIGEVPVPPTSPDPGFWPWIRLYGPGGGVLSGSGTLVGQISARATLTGTYTVIVGTADTLRDATGDYLLRLAKAPGNFTVPPGDEGGQLFNGEAHQGHIGIGDLDMWTFTANQNDAIELSIGEIPVPPTMPDPGFWPWIRLYGPNGGLLSASGPLVAQISARATISGTFTVVVGTADTLRDAQGDYLLRLAKIPGPFTVPTGDDGGAMTNNVAHPGRIALGDLDLWTFYAPQGNTLTLTASEVPVGPGVPDPGFWPWIRMFDPNGVQLGSASGNTSAQLVRTAPLSGLYTVIVGTADTLRDATGDYTLKVIGATSPPPPPVSVDDPLYTTPKDTPLVTAAPGVMGNDLNVAGATAAVVTGVSAGVLALNPNGGFTYTPPAGFVGTATFTYRATNAAGPGNVATVTIQVTSTPIVQPPVAVYASNITGNTVTVRWTPPASGLPPTGYLLEGGVQPGVPLATIPTGSTTPIFVLNVPTGSFYVRMKTVSNGAISAASNEIRIHVNVPVAPSAPASLTGMANGQAVALAWRNTFAGGAPQNVILDVSGTLSGSINLGNVESFAFPSIPAGAYTFSVRAANAGGVSPSSNAVSLSFPNTCAAPQAPQNFLAYKTGNVLHLLWDPPAAGNAPTHFQLNVSGAINVSVPLPTRGITAPVPPGSYTFSVAAVNACGTSPATPTQTVVIP